MHESTLLIAGYGVSGQGAARLASALKLPYYIVDERDTPEMHAAASALNPPPLGFCTGWKPGIPLPQCDEVLLSPGIRLSSPFGTALRAAATRTSLRATTLRRGRRTGCGISPRPFAR